MFEVGYSVITASSSTGGPTAAPPAHFFKPRQARRARPVEPRVTAAVTIQHKLVASWAVLLVGDQSEINRLTDCFRKNTRPYLEAISLSLSTRRLGRRIGIGSALRRTVAKLLKRYAQSFVRLVEAACCSGFDLRAGGGIVCSEYPRREPGPTLTLWGLLCGCGATCGAIVSSRLRRRRPLNEKPRAELAGVLLLQAARATTKSGRYTSRQRPFGPDPWRGGSVPGSCPQADLAVH